MKRYVSAIALRATLFAALLVCANTLNATAQTVPAPWVAADIGAPTLSGSATHSSGVFTITGAGADVYGTSDQFMFVYRQISGDVDIVAKIVDLDGSSSYAKAGVMIRKSLNANSAHAFSHATAGAGVRLLRRLSDGGSTTSLTATSAAAPVWVRAKRVGSQVTSYWSSNGTSWTTIGTDTISFGTSVYVGIAVNGRNVSSRATAVVSNVTVTGGQSSGALPAGQQTSDIGSPAVAGSATYSSTTASYTVKAGGTDIWGTADQFRYVYQPVTGNVEIVARVASITNTNEWAKAGVMVRESLAANARHAMVVTSIAKGYAFQRRPDPGAYSEHTAGGAGAPPGWVKLVRSGDLFDAYRSADGTTWTKIGSDTIPMGDTAYVGLAATSHNATTATTVVISNVKITAAAGNQSPAVSITSPTNGVSVTLPTTVSIAATASDPENRMASVDFYAGSTLILRDTTAPYSATWAPTAAGTYPLTAVAHDADGGSSTSSTVSVTVKTAGNNPPTVSLTSPAAGASFTAPATITLSATASDPENQLARVEFFRGTTRIATDTTAPYSFSWTNVAAGTYTITAVAFDTAGASATSAARTITVSTVPVGPPKTVVFTASTDHATNVTKYVLKIFAASANPATATPLATSDMGKPTPASNGDITVDRATFFSGLATGSYLATVTAVGPGGQTQSASIAFTR